MSFEIVEQEEQRLADVCESVDSYLADRKGKLAEHDAKIKAFEVERLESQCPREKDRLTREIRNLSQYDPAKYLSVFDQVDTPYLAGVAIQDDNPRIGKKHILLGKQGLVDGVRVIVADWRKAEISKLYYEWEEGEDYEDDIAGQERSGKIERKIAYGIHKRDLISLQTGSGRLEKAGGCWGEPVDGSNASLSRKEAAEDHRLVDIVALISREQFGLITRQHEGCLYLTGGAGCGKTTVAIHRLSYLLFNDPNLFRPHRCLVVMFNRSLRDYVKATSTDLLTDKLPVETYHSWAQQALRRLGVDPIFSASVGKGLEGAKKSTLFYRALKEHASLPNDSDPPLADLGRFFADESLLQRHLGRGKKIKEFLAQGDRLLSGARELSFDDAGILLHLCQLRQGREEVEGILEWYDHIMVDEAQDLSLVELKSLEYATSKRRSMSICADAKQKILDFVDGSGFAAFQVELQSKGLASGELKVSYRSTAQIMALASKVAGIPEGKVVNEGSEPRFHSFNHEQDTLRHLHRSVKALLASDDSALTAIICRYKNEAQAIFKELRDIKGVRLQTSSLTFEPGVLITNAHQVKGLEFSGVILWNPSKKAYPITDLGRNLLYVAITRASGKLAIFHHEPLSDLFGAY